MRIATYYNCPKRLPWIHKLLLHVCQGLCNLCSPIMELLKVGRVDGKKGSRFPVLFGDAEREA